MSYRPRPIRTPEHPCEKCGGIIEARTHQSINRRFCYRLDCAKESRRIIERKRRRKRRAG